MKLFVTLIFSGFIFFGFGQLDSASIVSVDEIVVNSVDDTGVTSQDTLLRVKVFVNDFDFLGEILISATDQATQYHLIMVKKVKTEIEAESLYDPINGVITMILPIDEATGILDIRVVIRNYQGANLPFLDTTYSN